MKKIYALLFAVMFALTASAQISWNVKGGIGLSKMSDTQEVDGEFKLAGKIGAGVEMPISPRWSIMPSLEFALKGAELKDDDYYNNGKISLTYIQLPILAKYLLAPLGRSVISLKAGPYIAYGLSGSNDVAEKWGWYDDIYESMDDAKRIDFGLVLGANVEFSRLVFGFEYESGLIKQSAQETWRNTAAYLTLGYKF